MNRPSPTAAQRLPRVWCQAWVGSRANRSVATCTFLEETLIATLAVLGGANLVGAVLSGANLTDAQELVQEQVDAARGNGQTRLPAGIVRPASWTQP